MTLWVDAQLSPALALWINEQFPELEAKSVRSLGMLGAKDFEIYQKAKAENVVLLSKDQDFVHLIDQNGSPPYLIWITCGNTSNSRMREILLTSLEVSLNLIEGGEKIVEITG